MKCICGYVDFIIIPETETRYAYLRCKHCGRKIFNRIACDAYGINHIATLSKDAQTA